MDMRMRSQIWKLSCLSVCLLGIVACSDENKSVETIERTNSEITEVNNYSEQVLARVADSNITDRDLERLLFRIGGENAVMMYSLVLSDEKNRTKMLESLIDSRAMSIKAEREMSSQDKIDLNRQVDHYREELLVKRYLESYADITPVSNSMAKSYYEQNKIEFSAENQYQFEVLTSYGELTTGQRKQLLTELGKAKSEGDWRKFKTKLVNENLPVHYQQANSRLSLLSSNLRDAITKIVVNPEYIINAKKPGVSEIMVDQSIMLIRVNKEIAGALKPFSEVSAEIRKRLAPVQMKLAISQSAEEARKNIKITY